MLFEYAGVRMTSKCNGPACALLAGGTLKDAATRIGISPNTAKTQLQVVFQKTRTGRQQELVSLLRSIPH